MDSNHANNGAGVIRKDYLQQMIALEKSKELNRLDAHVTPPDMPRPRKSSYQDRIAQTRQMLSMPKPLKIPSRSATGPAFSGSISPPDTTHSTSPPPLHTSILKGIDGCSEACCFEEQAQKGVKDAPEKNKTVEKSASKTEKNLWGKTPPANTRPTASAPTNGSISVPTALATSGPKLNVDLHTECRGSGHRTAGLPSTSTGVSKDGMLPDFRGPISDLKPTMPNASTLNLPRDGQPLTKELVRQGSGDSSMEHSPVFDFDAFPKTPMTPGFFTSLPYMESDAHKDQEVAPAAHFKYPNYDSSSDPIRAGTVVDVSPVSPMSDCGVSEPWSIPQSISPPRDANLLSYISQREPQNHSARGHAGTFGEIDYQGKEDIFDRIIKNDKTEPPILDKSNGKLHRRSWSVSNLSQSRFSTDTSNSQSSAKDNEDSDDEDSYHAFLVDSYSPSKKAPARKSIEPTVAERPKTSGGQSSKSNGSKPSFWSFKSAPKAPLKPPPQFSRDSFLPNTPTTKVFSFNDRPTVKGARLQPKNSTSNLKPRNNAKAERILGAPVATLPVQGARPSSSDKATEQGLKKKPTNRVADHPVWSDSSTISSIRFQSGSSTPTARSIQGQGAGLSTSNTTPVAWKPDSWDKVFQEPRTPSKSLEGSSEPHHYRDINFSISGTPTSLYKRRDESMSPTGIRATTPTRPPPQLPQAEEVASVDKQPQSDIDAKNGNKINAQDNIRDGMKHDEIPTRPDIPRFNTTPIAGSLSDLEIHVLAQPTNPEGVMKPMFSPGFGAKARKKPRPLQLGPRPPSPKTTPPQQIRSASVNAPPSKHDFSKLRQKASAKSIHNIDPISKVLVVCCSCQHFHDLPQKIYDLMSKPDDIVQDGAFGISGLIGVTVKCPWCGHGMSRSCCEGYSAVVYLRERLH